ncbi:MAG: LysM peptidoglycan-binding domain-containing protein [Anaerolineae bacterium]
MRRLWLKLLVLAALILVVGLVGVSATATAESALRPGYSGSIVHVVRWGDTLSSIADRYGTSPILIINANGIRNPNHLVVGVRLVIPVKGYVAPAWTAPRPAPLPAPIPGPAPAPGSCIPYTIQPGDSVSSIAARFGVSDASLIQVNNIINPNYIHAGVTIRVCDVAYTPPAQVVWQPAPQVVVQPVAVVAPPPPGPGPVCTTRYIVGDGDTLDGIAARHGADMQRIRWMNNLPNDAVWVGMSISVPCGGPPPPGPCCDKPAPPPPPPPGPCCDGHPNYVKPQPLAPAVCNPSVAVTYPRENQTVHGVINIVGTANIENFQFYKLEYGAGDVPFKWVSIGTTHPDPLTGTHLGTWDTSTVPGGQYTLRLTAVNNQGQFPQPCDVNIVVDN